MAADGDDVTRAIVRLQQQGKLPANLTQGTVDAMKKSLRRYFGKISADKIQEFTDAAREAVEKTLKTEQEVRPNAEQSVTVGSGTSDARTELTAFLEEATGKAVADKFNMDFFQRIARQVALGAGKQVAMNLDQTRVDEYPALELLRVYDREIPRGEKREHGQIVEDEENGWPARWEAAGGELIDGRMVALKSSDVWQKLGDGEGGYDDTLGNPFPPFAFNSGYDVDEVSRADAVELGLMEDDDKAQGADLDMDELIALPVEAKMYAASVAHRALMAGDVAGHEFHGNQWTGKTAFDVADKLEKDFPGLKMDLAEGHGKASLSRIVVPAADRSKGIGTKAMTHLTDWADANGKTVTLSPSSDFGGNKTKLVEFYKRFGFVENKGRNKDFSVSDTMIREPKGTS